MFQLTKYKRSDTLRRVNPDLVCAFNISIFLRQSSSSMPSALYSLRSLQTSSHPSPSLLFSCRWIRRTTARKGGSNTGDGCGGNKYRPGVVHPLFNAFKDSHSSA